MISDLFPRLRSSRAGKPVRRRTMTAKRLASLVDQTAGELMLDGLLPDVHDGVHEIAHTLHDSTAGHEAHQAAADRWSAVLAATRRRNWSRLWLWTLRVGAIDIARDPTERATRSNDGYDVAILVDVDELAAGQLVLVDDAADRWGIVTDLIGPDPADGWIVIEHRDVVTDERGELVVSIGTTVRIRAPKEPAGSAHSASAPLVNTPTEPTR